MTATMERWDVRPVADVQAHVLHAYFDMCPESPDGRWVLAFVSRQPDGQVGDVCLFGRESGEHRVLASGIEVEDSHRQACQQFVAGGSAVVFHHLHGDVWRVEAADVATGRRRVLAEHRQVGFCQADLPVVATMPLHWDPGDDGDIHLLDLPSSRCVGRVPLEAIRPAAVKLRPDAALEHSRLALAFPLLSPDGSRVACKVAVPGLPEGGDFRSPQASTRMGLFTYDLRAGQVRGCSHLWGHPAWHPDGRRILTVRSQRLVWLDTDSGAQMDWPQLPAFPGSHPSVSRDGRFAVTDSNVEHEGGRCWQVHRIDVAGNTVELVHRHSADRPATTSWRPAHPHPVFSHDGQRLYFNLCGGRYTRLHVAAAPRHSCQAQ